MTKLQIKDRRTPQQKAYKAMRMARCGCMTQETERALYKPHKRHLPEWVEAYAVALGITQDDAWKRYYRQTDLIGRHP